MNIKNLLKVNPYRAVPTQRPAPVSQVPSNKPAGAFRSFFGTKKNVASAGAIPKPASGFFSSLKSSPANSNASGKNSSKDNSIFKGRNYAQKKDLKSAAFKIQTFSASDRQIIDKMFDKYHTQGVLKKDYHRDKMIKDANKDKQLTSVDKKNLRKLLGK